MLLHSRSTRIALIPASISISFLSGVVTFEIGTVRWMWLDDLSFGCIFADSGLASVAVHLVRRPVLCQNRNAK